jgi:hypothetical protein
MGRMVGNKAMDYSKSYLHNPNAVTVIPQQDEEE